MYEVKRQNGRVIIAKGSTEVFNAAESAYIVYEASGVQKVNTVKELPDPELLLALANAVFIRQ